MNELSFLNFGLILALVPICQGVVQMVKSDNIPPYLTRILSLVVGIALVFLVRLSGVEGVSDVIENPYLAGLTGLVVALIASGSYNMTKNDIVNKIAKSTSDVTVPSELVDVTKEDEASTLKNPNK